jgi:hypothetical protein
VADWDAEIVNNVEHNSASEQSLSVIGSLVSYSINYMDKQPQLTKGAMQQFD